MKIVVKDNPFTMRVIYNEDMRTLMRRSSRDPDTQYCFMIHNSISRDDYKDLVQELIINNIINRRADYIGNPREAHGNPRPTVQVSSLREFPSWNELCRQHSKAYCTAYYS